MLQCFSSSGSFSNSLLLHKLTLAPESIKHGNGLPLTFTCTKLSNRGNEVTLTLDGDHSCFPLALWLKSGFVSFPSGYKVGGIWHLMGCMFAGKGGI